MSTSPRPASAFTLVELLVVMGIAVLLTGLAVPAISTILGGRAVARGVNDLSGIVEYARAEAMARRTYVYVCMLNTTNSDGNAELRVAVAVSPSGLNSWGGLKPLTKIIRLPNLISTGYDGTKQAGVGKLPSALQDYVQKIAPSPSDPLRDDQQYVNYVYTGYGFNNQNPPTTPFIVAGQNFNDSPYLGFSPEGEIMAGSDPYNAMFRNQVCIGLAPARGAVAQANAKDGAVLVAYGGSAKFRIIRP